MPTHDWSRVDPSLYHHFHQCWASHLAQRLNAGILPPHYSALVEPHASDDLNYYDHIRTGSAEEALSNRASRVVVRHRLDRVVGVIEIVSPGHKATPLALQLFLARTLDFLRNGTNVLLVDPFPRTPRDPDGIHDLIWSVLSESDQPPEYPPGEPLSLASYVCRDSGREVYLDFVRVGLPIPEMPLFLGHDCYVPVPLEPAYQTAWENCPADMRHLVEHGRLPDE